jgi:hypothetical protein
MVIDVPAQSKETFHLYHKMSYLSDSEWSNYSNFLYV